MGPTPLTDLGHRFRAGRALKYVEHDEPFKSTAGFRPSFRARLHFKPRCRERAAEQRQAGRSSHRSPARTRRPGLRVFSPAQIWLIVS